MPRTKTGTPPKLRHHTGSGQAVVTFKGKDFYLGLYGSKESEARYHEMVARWLTTGTPLPASPEPEAKADAVAGSADTAPTGCSIVELVERYREYAATYYRDSRERVNIDHAMAPVVRLFGRIAADAFTPKELDAVRVAMARGDHITPKSGRKGGRKPRDLALSTINARCNRIRRVFRWGVARGLVHPDTLARLQALEPLKPGRCDVRVTEPVKPVAKDLVDATVENLAEPLKTMVRLQQLCGMRSGELVIMRTGDIDRSGSTWVYTPSHHKTSYRGLARRIHIGPQGRALLEPLLRKDLNEYIFSPARAAEARYKRMRAKRVTPVQPSQKCRRKAKPKKKPGAHYTTQSYYRALVNAIRKHEVAHWTPHRLRHTVGTLLRKRFGLESSAAALGHATLAANQVYSERDEALAVAAMEAVG